jgi:hypothetical protein
MINLWRILYHLPFQYNKMSRWKHLKNAPMAKFSHNLVALLLFKFFIFIFERCGLTCFSSVKNADALFLISNMWNNNQLSCWNFGVILDSVDNVRLEVGEELDEGHTVANRRPEGSFFLYRDLGTCVWPTSAWVIVANVRSLPQVDSLPPC